MLFKGNGLGEEGALADVYLLSYGNHGGNNRSMELNF